MTSFEPSRANARAAAAPIPVDAPVMKTTLPARSEAMHFLQELRLNAGWRLRTVYFRRSARRAGATLRHAATAPRIAAIASGRGKLFRYASATRLDGAGRA